MYRTNKHFYRRLTQICEVENTIEKANVENDKEHYQKLYLERNIKARETESNIQTNTSIYLKCLTHLRLLKGDKKNIITPILKIKEFVKPEVSRFKECEISTALVESAQIEEKRIKTIYIEQFLSHFEEINKNLEKGYK